MSSPALPPTPALDLDIDDFFESAYRLSHLARHRLQVLLATHNLTPPQYTAMRTIENRGNSISVSALAEAGHQLSPTVTGILNRLEQRGLIIRRRSESDRRHQLVSITQAGRDLLEAISRDLRRAMGLFLAEMNPAERQILLETIRNLANKLDASHPNDKKEDHVLE